MKTIANLIVNCINDRPLDVENAIKYIEELINYKRIKELKIFRDDFELENSKEITL